MHNAMTFNQRQSRLAVVRIGLLMIVAILVSCDDGMPAFLINKNKVDPDPRPAFVLDPSKPFVIEFGRGSGWNGLDIVKLDNNGAVQLTRYEGRPIAESASLKLTAADVTALVDLVNKQKLTSMGRAYYNTAIDDGTQLVLWIEQSHSQKAIYFSNSFPDQIIAFSSGLDAWLDKAGLSTVTWHKFPKTQADIQQKALWARTE